MSIQGGAGAAQAAKEIIQAIDDELDKTDTPDTLLALGRVRAEAESIRKTAADGWY